MLQAGLTISLSVLQDTLSWETITDYKLVLSIVSHVFDLVILQIALQKLANKQKSNSEISPAKLYDWVRQ